MEIGPEEATSGEKACCYCLNPDHTACRLSDNRLHCMLAFLCMRAWLVIFKKGDFDHDSVASNHNVEGKEDCHISSPKTKYVSINEARNNLQKEQQCSQTIYNEKLG